MKKAIEVYSEIETLKEILVHTPGDEIIHVSPNRLDELLFSAILDKERAVEEHKEFINILKENGVKVVQLSRLTAETYDSVSNEIKNNFMETWLDEALPILNETNRKIVKEYLLSISKTRNMIKKMMSGIEYKELNIDSKESLIVDPMPNLYFTRDPFATIGNGVSMNKMKYQTRKRETIFSRFIFDYNEKYKNVPKYFSDANLGLIEGGDIFVYNSKTLVIGNSERTNHEAVLEIGKNIKNNKDCEFERIVVINVPIMPNLMHLDTWITMLDYDKFLYSPNMMSVLKIWDLNLTKDKLELIEQNKTLEEVLHSIIGKKPILIPVAGKGANQLEIDIETIFDATNYLVIRPGVVVGYDRNKKTTRALQKAGIKVLSFEGNQLSLGMGSARCMSMPLVREKK